MPKPVNKKKKANATTPEQDNVARHRTNKISPQKVAPKSRFFKCVHEHNPRDPGKHATKSEKLWPINNNLTTKPGHKPNSA